MSRHSVPATPSPSPRGKTPEKRDRILDAAIKVFAKEGFYNARVSQIAELAGVADGTIYLYFKSKDDLLIQLFEDRVERINQKVRDAIQSTESAVARLQLFVELYFDFIAADRSLAEVITVELRQSSKFIKEYKNPKFADFLRILAGIVEAGQKAGELRRDLEPTLVARALFGSLDEIARAHLTKRKFDLNAAKKQLSSLFLAGLAVVSPAGK
jgi:TetR/AcrR family fatty acid metabolism transcriptional regulator